MNKSTIDAIRNLFLCQDDVRKAVSDVISEAVFDALRSGIEAFGLDRKAPITNAEGVAEKLNELVSLIVDACANSALHYVTHK